MSSQVRFGVGSIPQWISRCWKYTCPKTYVRNFCFSTTPVHPCCSHERPQQSLCWADWRAKRRPRPKLRQGLMATAGHHLRPERCFGKLPWRKGCSKTGRLGSPKLQLKDDPRFWKKGPTWFFYWGWDVFFLALQIGVQVYKKQLMPKNKKT